MEIIPKTGIILPRPFL